MISSKNINDWIIQLPQVKNPPIKNDYAKVSFDRKNKNQIVINILLQVSVQESHNRMAHPE